MTRKRFYEHASATAENTVALDGRAIKTPEKRLLRLPTAMLAAAVAAEWEKQAQVVDPATMFLTKLANTAIDRVEPARDRIIDEMLEFAGSDLVCYRADRPPDLVASQKSHWDPVVDWASSDIGAAMEVTVGIVHRPQPKAALLAVRRHFQGIEPFQLTALHNLMTLTGSALLAAMTGAGALSPEAAWAAAHVDEDHQIRHWGWDSEARHRRDLRKREFMACIQFLGCL